ncbi:hypothetical protein EDC90_10281 [Martelella mediterranea]|uniref:Uncharacterized protein n=1 Tax=Martelella mediterranea TaxID=293089 RepID=A0A4R3NM27_9HYPH|nr:hypothetical protein EDC90_10281 [Martelella mediterranea]
MNDGKIACSCFVIAGSEPPGAFELVEASLDLVSEGIHEAIDGDRLFAICSAGNDGCSAARLGVVADVIGIVSAVRDQNPGFGQVLIDEHVIALVVRDFAASDLGPDRQAPGIGDQMNLGREATF